MKLDFETRDMVKWNCVTSLRKFINQRAFELYLQNEYDNLQAGSRKWANAHLFNELNQRGNLLMLGGGSCLWEDLIGNGTGTGAQTLTYFNNGNAYIGTGDSSTAAVNTQTDLQASTNKLRVAMDASFPLHYDGSATKTITAASNATPISVTATSHGYTSGDGVVITGVTGNTNANGTWILDVVDANTFTLRGSAGNSAYVSGGVATRNTVLVFRSTFGSASGNYAWAEWGVFNGITGGRMLNRVVAAQGTKASPSIWQFSVAISLA